ncbi:glycosyltransferase [Romboutsia sedimentorum]|uniref:Glycosyltransferase n=1 Tax=Romboutsia sedimentorum TaxID=1368474 RepID=A0ABT7E9N6_9FIRM|nr:glycosyltransferase [Romboutsia sedimentorum]MDK2562686.1 glycosyltransferase [Romboutsia sedimentorum]
MIKNQILVKQMLEIINTMLEASQHLYEIAIKKDYSNFMEIVNDMNNAINSIHSNIVNLKKAENITINVDLACENANYSLNRIANLSKSRSRNILDKIEFELIPILEDMYLQLYFWGSIYPDKEKIHNYYQNELIPLCSNKYIDQSEINGKYKYDLSVIVVGYNNLEYTKLCIESILKYVPDNINYELILLNHGSIDDTKKYFESIAPTKQVDILKNGGSPTAAIRTIEGKYCLTVSNDVVVTENAIVNMIKCIESDDKTAWVVPTTPNVSNNQTIPANYNTIDEMHEFSRINNKSDKYRWEQRVRLCNPIDLKSSKIWFSSNGIGWGGYFHTSNIMSFPDDKVSMILRRKGYKMMLAKDAHCYHFGSITLKDEVNNYKDKEGNVGSETFYTEGRKEFSEFFKIDPWGTGFGFDFNLFTHLLCNDDGHVDVLGINCGMGSNPLKIKESIKENVHNLDVEIYNITDEKCYIEDLKGSSDVVEYTDDFSIVENVFGNKKFNYIVFESKLETYANPIEIILKLKKCLVENGIIAIKTYNIDFKNEIKNIDSKSIESGYWIIFK